MTQNLPKHSIYQQFQTALLHWYDQYGRHDLPWQQQRTAYRVWISEIMLQQTQVQTVIPYFEKFIQRFTDITAIATAKEDEVLAYWSGLGYYSRAKNIYLAAKIIHNQYQGIFPTSIVDILQLPGIGKTTAAAILSQAFNQPYPILDANVKRVLARFFMVEGTNQDTEKTLWDLAKQCMAENRATDYTQAIMDFGALCCKPKNPNCYLCPVANDCLAKRHAKVHELPTKKLKAKLPIKKEQFILFFNKKREVYLEKRPASGIWSSLWCLPVLQDSRGDRPIFCAFKHSFTHYHLNIEVFCESQTCPTAKSAGKWIAQHELNTIGLPTPMQYILELFYISSH